MESQYTDLLSVAIDVPVVHFWKAIEIFLCNPRITSKNVAGIVLDHLPILQFENRLNIKELQSLARSADANELNTMLQSLINYQNELSIDELKDKLNHPEGGESFVWIPKILYKNIKYRAFSHKCYLLGK